MVQAATPSDARDACALGVMAKPVPFDAAVQDERFRSCHVGPAIVSAMLVPALTVVALAGPRATRAVHRERDAPRVAATASPPPASSPAVLAGRILDAEGRPASRASVRALAIDDASRPVSTVADGDGRFRFAAFAAREVRILAEDDEDGLVVSEPVATASPHDVVLVLGHAPSLRGVVVDERRVPVPRANVRSWGGSPLTDRVVVADDMGRFAIARVAPGANRVTAWAHGFASTTTASQLGSSASNVQLVLPAALPIVGVVVDPLGHPVEGARVVACENEAEEAAISGPHGVFHLPATTAGCEARAMHARFSGSQAATAWSGRILTIQLASGGAIEGSVVDERGAPINAFTMVIDSFSASAEEGHNPGRAGETLDALRGAFRFEGLTAGTYVLRATTPEGAASDPQSIEVARGRVVRGVGFVVTTAVAATHETEGAEGSMAEAPVAEAP